MILCSIPGSRFFVSGFSPQLAGFRTAYAKLSSGKASPKRNRAMCARPKVDTHRIWTQLFSCSGLIAKAIEEAIRSSPGLRRNGGNTFILEPWILYFGEKAYKPLRVIDGIGASR